MLDIYDMQLVSYGRELIHYRNDFIDQMNGIIRDIHFNLSGGKEELEIRYEPNTEADVMEKALKKSRMQDLRQKQHLPARTGRYKFLCKQYRHPKIRSPRASRGRRLYH